MVRSLWSAATGMNAQQVNVDTIANNLANVNSVGYKAQVAEFKSLLYQTLQTATTTANGDPKPVTSQEAFLPLKAIRHLPLKGTDSLRSVMPTVRRTIRETVILHGQCRKPAVSC